MKNKPLIFNLLSLLYLGIAFSIPLQIMYLYGHSINDYHLIYHKISLFNWLVMAFSLFNSYALYNAKKFLKISIPVNLIIVGINNWIVSSVGVDYGHIQTQLATIGLTLFTSSLVFSKAISVIENPNLIWWQWAKRIKKQIPVTVVYNNEELYRTNTYDLSRSGTYLRYNEDELKEKSSSKASRILKGETVDLIIGKNTENKLFRCKAKVVRKMTENSGEYPSGIGLKFEELSINNILPLFKLIYSNGSQSHELSQ